MESSSVVAAAFAQEETARLRPLLAQKSRSERTNG